MSYTIYQLLWLFLIYAFLGWCTEVVFVAVTRGQVVNRGFLNGPVCPIYGLGMICVLLVLGPVSDNLPLLFVGGTVFCSLIELVGGWILEKVFHTRWWDYSNKPFNLGGYICLSFSLVWGLAVVFVVQVIHPIILMLVNLIPHTLGVVLLAVLYTLFATDMVMTLVTIAGIKRRLKEMEKVAGALHSVGDTLSDMLGNRAKEADAKLDQIKDTSQEKMAEGKERLAESREKFTAQRAQEKEKLALQRAQEKEKLSLDRQKLSAKVTDTAEELQARRARLEQLQMQLRAEYQKRRASFGARRLGKAFPNIRAAVQKRLDNMDKN